MSQPSALRCNSLLCAPACYSFLYSKGSLALISPTSFLYERPFCDPSKSFLSFWALIPLQNVVHSIFKVVFLNSPFTYLYTKLHTDTLIHTHTLTHVQKHSYSYTPTPTHLYTHSYTHLHTYTATDTHTHTYTAAHPHTGDAVNKHTQLAPHG